MKNKKNKGLARLIFNSFIYFVISVIVIGVLFTLFTVNRIVAESPKLDIEKINSFEPTKIYDGNNELIAVLGGEVRENISYNDLPQTVVDAFLAVEDSRFQEHNGFDIPRFLKSFLVNIKAGGIQQGGSTITMQLVDNSYFNVDASKQTFIQKLKQKISEISMSQELERKTSKQDILTAYLNKINFGENIRGIGKASEYYFGKHVSQINLSESAFLAGVINAPNLFNPYGGIYKNEKGDVINYLQYATNRRNQTLYLMKLHGYISQTEHDLAVNTPLEFQLSGKIESVKNKYLAYTEIVEKEVVELTGKNPHTVQMTIYTALDKKTQDLSNEISLGNAVQLINRPGFQIGSAVVDNVNHELIAINPGIGEYKGDNRTNFGYVVKNQIGSTAKPIISYTPSFDILGYSTGHEFSLKPFNFRGTSVPVLDNPVFGTGRYPFDKTIALSFNKSSVDTYYRIYDKIGQSGYDELVKKLNLDVPSVTDQFAIGGGNLRLTPFELAGAYSALASGGTYVKPTTIRKVVIHATGETFEPVQVKHQPYSKEAAYLMSTVLRKAVDSGANIFLSSIKNNFPVYAKTGTTDWGSDGLQYGIFLRAARDNWVASYSGNTTVVVWTGFDSRKINGNSYLRDYELNMQIPQKISKALLTSATLQRPNVEIQKPEGVSSIRIIPGIYPYLRVPETAGKVGKEALIKTSELSNLQEAKDINLPTNSGMKVTVDAERANLTISFDTFEKSPLLGKPKYKVVMKDATGKTVVEKELASASEKISLEGVIDGVYTITGAVSFESGFTIPESAFEYTHQKTSIEEKKTNSSNEDKEEKKEP